MITGFAHTCFVVKDLDASIEYYQDKLGFSHAFDFIDDEGKRYGVYLHINGRVFFEMFVGEPEAYRNEQSYKHICLEVDDIEATVEDLRGKGIDVTDPEMGSDGSWQSWLTDPDGNRMELHCYTADSKQLPYLQ